MDYAYDAFDRRVYRDGNDEEVLLWWGDKELSEHRNIASKPVIQNDLHSHPDSLNACFGRALEGDALDIEYFHKNYLDHVYAVSDDNGNIDENYRYTAFGEVEIFNATATTQMADSAINNDILWNTKRWDDGSGLYLYKYRHYHPELGRWLSRDPIGEHGGRNLYGFAENSSMANYDRLGKEIAGGLSGAAGMHAGPAGLDVGMHVLYLPPCDVCVTIFVIIRIGPGGGVHAGGGVVLVAAENIEGPTIGLGASGWVAGGGGGSLSAEVIPNGVGAGGFKGEGGVGGAVGVHLSPQCTECETVRNPLHLPWAMGRATMAAISCAMREIEKAAVSPFK